LSASAPWSHSNPGLPFTIGEIYRRLTTGDPKSDLPAALQEARRAGQRLSQACVSAIQDFTSASDNTFSGIKQTITARLNLWLNPMVDAATSESDSTCARCGVGACRFTLACPRQYRPHRADLQPVPAATRGSQHARSS
jgi:type IV secretory pathway TraG/TraD family ATPase VirD4